MDSRLSRVASVAGPMTAPVVPQVPVRVECPRCSWPVVHRDVMLGLCPRCGRHLDARLLG